MTELRFHRSIYRGTSVDEAIKLFTRFGTIERGEEADYWVVKVAAKSPAREREIVGELGNYALGLTVKGGGAQ